VTGEHPFNVTEEDVFREDVLSANVDWARLIAYPRVKIIIQNLLKVDPDKRWDANTVLAFAQNDFIVDLQRFWKGHMARANFRRRCKALLMIQARVKGLITKIRYRKGKVSRTERAATTIQARFRSYQEESKFKKARKALLQCQANVICRQCRRAYLKMKSDTVKVEAYIRRYLAMTWYNRIKTMRQNLENNVENITEMINKYNMDADQFKDCFVNKSISGPFKYLGTFEDYELARAKRTDLEKTYMPKMKRV
jgi:hypothetical protein